MPVTKVQRTGFVIGLLVFLLLLFIPIENLAVEARLTAAVVALMASWWISEALPLAVTALLPLVLFPILGILPITQVSTHYADPIIFLFLGGFLIAIAIEHWHLHKRVALYVLQLTGVQAERLLFGFMFITAFLSSWLSNTAATLMMLTIGTAVLSQLTAKLKHSDTASAGQNLETALMLGIAYAASIGGVATLIGTPANAILAGILRTQFDIDISFFDWLLFALPLSIIMLLLAWFYMSRIAFKLHKLPNLGESDFIQTELRALGPISKAEQRVFMVFCLVVTAWVARGLFNLVWLNNISDAAIAIIGAILLFILPSANAKQPRLLAWSLTSHLPWDVLILFGGGLALAAGVADSGLTVWLGQQLQWLDLSIGLLTLVLVLLVVFFTEISSNTATASLLFPVLGAFALANEIPILTLLVPTAIAASFAFMLPVATPPNAIVFSSRKVSIAQMAKTGLWLNLIGTLLISLFAIKVLPLLWQ